MLNSSTIDWNNCVTLMNLTYTELEDKACAVPWSRYSLNTHTHNRNWRKHYMFLE